MYLIPQWVNVNVLLAHWNFKFIEKDGITSEKINLTNHFSLVFPQINLDKNWKQSFDTTFVPLQPFILKIYCFWDSLITMKHENFIYGKQSTIMN